MTLFKPTYEELEAQIKDLKDQLSNALAKVAELQGKKTCSLEVEAIYEAYPRKVGKGAAIKAINKALKTISAEDLLTKVEQYAKAIAWQEKRYIPNPSTWFNQERWMDDPKEWENPNKPAQQQPTTSKFSL